MMAIAAIAAQPNGNARDLIGMGLTISDDIEPLIRIPLVPRGTAPLDNLPAVPTGDSRA
jgi:hypothetical protein